MEGERVWLQNRTLDLTIASRVTFLSLVVSSDTQLIKTNNISNVDLIMIYQ